MVTTDAAGRPTAAPGSLQKVMGQHPLLFYSLMAYAFSWVLVLPLVLSEWGLFAIDHTVGVIAFALNTFAGPTLAAVIMTRITEGKEGVARLRARCLQWRAGWQWYLFILLGVPALYLLGLVAIPGGTI